MEVFTTCPRLLLLETRGDHCHLVKDRAGRERGPGQHPCPCNLPYSPPPRPEPGGPQQPALPPEVTRNIRLQHREVIWEDKGALVLRVHLPGQEMGSGGTGRQGEPGCLSPRRYLAIGPGGPRAEGVVGVPEGHVLGGSFSSCPCQGCFTQWANTSTQPSRSGL